MQSNPLLDSFDFLKNIQFEYVAIIVAGYIFAIWLMVTAWAARDASRRYSGRFTAALWAIAILVLGFPALMFYFVIRPEVGEEQETGYASGGLQVPLINFIGKNNEMLFNLQIKINPDELTQAVQDMKVDIEWLSKDKNKEISISTIEAEAKAVSAKANYLQSLLNKFRAQVGNSKINIKDLTTSLRKIRPQSQPTAAEVVIEVFENSSPIIPESVTIADKEEKPAVADAELPLSAAKEAEPVIKGHDNKHSKANKEV